MAKKRKYTSQRGRDAPTAKRTGLITGVSLTDSDGWREILCSGYRPVMECPTIRRCVDVYAHLIASMTIRIMKNGEKGDERIKDGLSRVIDINPMPHMTRVNWLTLLTRTMLTRGNAFVLPIYRAGFLSALKILPPGETYIIQVDESDYRVQYRGISYTPDAILNFVFEPDENRPYIGKGWSAHLSDVVKAITATTNAKLAVQSSTFPSIIVKVDGFSKELQTAEGRDELAEKFVVSKKAGKPWMIQADSFDVQQVKPLSLTDLAIKDSVELDLKSAAALTGIPAFELGVGSYNADEHRKFVATSVMYIAQIIQQTLTDGLLYAPDRYISLNPMSLMAYNMTDLVNNGKEMVDRNALTRNEWRGMIGFAPREDMEQKLILENYIPEEKAGDQKKLKGGGEDEADSNA